MLAAPTTRLKKTTGMTIILSRGMKRSPKGLTQTIPGPTSNPTTAPSISPRRILMRRLDLKYQFKRPFLSVADPPFVLPPP